MVLRAGHQWQVRIVVAGQHVLVVATGGLELQRQHLNLLIGALAQGLLVGDALRQIGARVGRAGGVPGAGSDPTRALGSGPGVGAGVGAGSSG